MSDRVLCPDCGRANEPGAVECAHCGFPLVGAPGAAPSNTPPAPSSTSGTPTTPRPEPPIVIRRPRQRPPRPDTTSTSLWLIFGTVAAIVILGVAINANRPHPEKPVEGASEPQQASADSLARIVARDSTNIAARHALADVLYDTANWPDAIVQYRAVVRMDSSRVTAMVDLGVCYFNLSDSPMAEKLFQLALNRDPHQPVALFDLGILYESRQEWNTALGYFHRALQSGPPPSMEQPLREHLTSAMQHSGATPRPLPDGR